MTGVDVTDRPPGVLAGSEELREEGRIEQMGNPPRRNRVG